MELSLTDRQLEILQLKAKRLTNAEIAEKLVISITTVKWHVRQIYNKFGVNNRSEAVTFARRAGLLEQKQQQKTPPQRKLPSPITPFIGREQELRELTTILTDPDTRLVTLVGAGGMGKTRLALKAAKSVQHNFRDGICWVEFSAVDKSELVFTTVEEYIAENIIKALGAANPGNENLIDLLISLLKECEILIILDSFEAIVFGAAFILKLLSETSKCKFLVASRQRLNLPGELLYPIAGLDQTHADDKELLSNDAVKLFIQEASRVSKSNFEKITELPGIERICSRLEGMPLAIELAAEWTRLLSVEEIEQELDSGLDFLDSGSTSIRTVFARSWNQLSDHQHTTFSHLAVFQRGFSRTAARHVAGANLSTLTALFDRSLIQTIEEGRYSLHDLLRKYAAEQLDERGERETTRDAHCAYFAGLVADQLEAVASGDHRIILADLDNIRAAWRWAVRRHRWSDLNQMLLPLDWFYNLRAFYEEAIAAMGMVVDELNGKNPQGLKGIVYGKALVHLGLEKIEVHGADDGAPKIHQGLEILRKYGKPEEIAWPLILSAFQGVFRNDPQTNEQNCLESLRIFENLGNPYGIAFALAVLGTHYRYVGQYSEARQAIDRALSISRSIDDQEGAALALRYLGNLNFHIGKFGTARENFREEAELWQRLSLLRARSETIRSIGETLLAEGNLLEAEQLIFESLTDFEQLKDSGNMFLNLITLGQIALQRKQLKQALDFLQDSRRIIEARQDHNEQARWWQLSGRISLEQGDLEAAHRAFRTVLEDYRQIEYDTMIEAFIDFANYLRQQSDYETAARLLGFVKSQTSLPAILLQNSIYPLHASLTKLLDENKLNILMDEGASLDQQEIVDHLLETA